jgi:spore germination cell wall hydrolase CwlJ-like protein
MLKAKKYLFWQILVAVSCIAAMLYTINVVGNPKGPRLLEVTYSDLTPVARKQIDCLADNIYYESAYEPQSGQIAVALVTLNRVNHPAFPKDVCGVVKQKTKSTCQFSWFCMNVPGKNTAVYEEVRKVALHVYSNYENIVDITKGSLYYHADYVNPGWNLRKTVVIGRHIFYKGNDHDAKTESSVKRGTEF